MAFTLKDAGGILKRYPIAIAGVVVSLIALGGYFVRGNRVADLNDQLNDVEARAQKILNEVHDAARLPEQYATLAAATKELDSRLMRGTDRATNQAYFYELEMQTGVKEINLQPSGPDLYKSAGGLYERIGYAITITGDYRQILDFIGRLESGRYFCHIVNASLIRLNNSSAPAAGSTVSLTINAELLGLP
jgi:hypothetical protein